MKPALYPCKKTFTNYLGRIFFGTVAPVLLLMAFSACTEQEEVSPEEKFVRVYHDGDLDKEFYPLELERGLQNGYLMLSARNIRESDFEGIHVMKTDLGGNLQWSVEVPGDYVAAVPALLEFNAGMYFFCMDRLGLGTMLMRIDEQTQEVVPERYFGEVTYPLAASVTPDGNLLLLGYDREKGRSTFAKISSSFNIAWQEDYDMQEDIEAEIITHLSSPRERLPFFTGVAEDGKYFFNGFFDFTLSVGFVNPADGSMEGVIHGFRRSGAISALQPLEAGRFALARYAFGKNYIFPGVDINTSGTNSSEQFDGFELPELVADAQTRLCRVNVAGKRLVVFASNAKSNQVVLYAYDEATGEFTGTHATGFNDELQVADILPTSDRGIAIYASSQVAGRFPRPAFFKISPDETAALAGVE